MLNFKNAFLTFGYLSNMSKLSDRSKRKLSISSADCTLEVTKSKSSGSSMGVLALAEEIVKICNGSKRGVAYCAVAYGRRRSHT